MKVGQAKFNLYFSTIMDLGTFSLCGNYTEPRNILQKGHRSFTNIIEKGEEISFSNIIKLGVSISDNIVQVKCVLNELQV